MSASGISHSPRASSLSSPSLLFTFRSLSLVAVAVALLILAPQSSLASDKWQTPTPEELSMTSIPQVPGAPAVILYREEISDDNLQVHSIYVRLKVLTESGKEYADVELPYGAQSSITDVSGRTIQPDGTIVPFTGKPYTKQIVKSKTVNFQAKVFTLPAVNVGSIIEYRYSWRYPDNRVYDPTWYIQTDLFLRQGHFMWKPFYANGFFRNITGPDGKVLDRIAWAQNLPEGAKVVSVTIPNKPPYYELNVHDVPPLIDEEHSPPMASISLRVAFYYTGSTGSEDYWRDYGKSWSKHANSFIGPGKEVRAAVDHLILPSDSPDMKARKIYAAVMELDNTDFTREKDKKEVKIPKNTDDVLTQKSGSGDEITMLYVAMARAAGLKAELAIVAPRSKRFFWPALLNFDQLEDTLAIVELGGKQVFLDPGQRYCPYGLLAWPDAIADGLQQTDAGAARVLTPENPYTASKILRIGDLTMNADGSIKGAIKISLTGIPALSWRHVFLRTDLTETQRDFKHYVEEMLPKGMTIELQSIQGMETYEQPLVANYHIEGPLGTPTSKRIIVPAQLFEVEAAPRFSSVNRTMPVDLHYGSRTSDAVRITLPPSMHWEAQPKGQSVALRQSAQYVSSFDLHDNSLTFRRTIDVNDVFYKVDDYPALHEFFAKVANSDNSQALVSLPAGAATPEPTTDKPAPAKGGTGE